MEGELSLLSESFRATITAINLQLVRQVHFLFVPSHPVIVDEAFVTNVTLKPVRILQFLNVLEQPDLLVIASSAAGNKTWMGQFSL